MPLVDNKSLKEKIFTLDPKYDVFRELTIKQERARWFEDEIPVANDRLIDLTNSEKDLLLKSISYFNFSELIVQHVLSGSVTPFLCPSQALDSFSVQVSMESVHHRFFQLAGTTFNISEERMRDICLNDKNLKDKQELIIDSASKIRTYNLDPSSLEGKKAILETLLLNNVIQEGLFFYSAFAYFFALRAIENKMNNFVSGIDLVLRDESLHLQNGIQAIQLILEENPLLLQDEEFILRIYNKMLDSLEIELNYLKSEFGGSRIFGVTYQELERYMKYILDRRLQELGFPPKFNINENPLKFLESQDLETLHNFFEVNADYENK